MAVTTAPVDATARAGGRGASEHELLLVRRGPRTGAHTIIAVHSTALGPALGGCRLWRYENLQAAIDDALRLSSAMTLKAAAAHPPPTCTSYPATRATWSGFPRQMAEAGTRASSRPRE